MRTRFAMLLTLCLIACLPRPCRASTESADQPRQRTRIDPVTFQHLKEMAATNLSAALEGIEPDQRVDYLLTLAQSAAMKRDIHEALSYLEAAGDLATKDQVGEILLITAGLYEALDDLPEAITRISRALQVAEEGHDSPLLKRALAYKAHLEYRRGLYSDSLTTNARLLELLTGADDQDMRAYCLAETAQVRCRLGDIAGAETGLREALDIYENSGNAKGMGDCYKTLGNLATNITASTSHYAHAILYYHEAHNIHGEANCNFNLGVALQRAGDHTGAIDYFNEAIVLFTRSSSVVGVGIAHMELGRTYFLMKDSAKAEATLTTAIGILRKGPDLARRAQAEEYLAELYRDQSDSAKARLHYENAIALYREAKMTSSVDKLQLLLNALP